MPNESENKAMANRQKAHEHEESISYCKADIYSVRRKVESEFRPSKEKDIVMMKLDEAAMWLNQVPVVFD